MLSQGAIAGSFHVFGVCKHSFSEYFYSMPPHQAHPGTPVWGNNTLAILKPKIENEGVGGLIEVRESICPLPTTVAMYHNVVIF